MEKKQKDLLIIIPAYNEEENITKVLESLEAPEIEEIADILVMNDASSDNTTWLAQRHKVHLVTHVFNLGYGSALQLGYKYAIRRRYSYVIQIDADGQHDICNIPLVYKALKTPMEDGRCPDIVIGSRFLKDSNSYKVSLPKRIAMKFFRVAIRLFTGQKISDPTSGLQGLNLRATLYYSKYRHFDNQYPDANMIIQMLLLGFRIQEIPATMHDRGSGTSMHSGLKPIFYMIHMFFSILAVTYRARVMKKDLGIGEQDIYIHEE